jgi:pyruvate formate lyase activating enzyme
MTIAGIVRSSLVDYPGLVSCVLFMPGCNYDCFYCHNRQLIDGTHQVIEKATVMDFLRRRAGQLDGVVLTGGEPTLQPDLLLFIKEIKELGYRVKLDTNGSSTRVLEKVLDAGLCDYFAVDWKAPKDRYQEICRGASDAETVLRTIHLLLERGADFEVRTTVLPQLREDDLILMAQELPAVPLYTLNRYRKPDRYLPADEAQVTEHPYSAEQVAALAERIRIWQPNVTI